MKTSFQSILAVAMLSFAFLSPNALLAQQSNNLTKVVDKSTVRPLNAATSEKMPFDYPNFEYWVKLQNTGNLWQYFNDENYRDLVNQWNQFHNPFWANAITAKCPYGTFDFTAGQSGVEKLNNVGDLAEQNRYDQNLTPTETTDILGQPAFMGKVQVGTTNGAPIQINQLPTRDPRTVTVKNNTVAQPNFTQNIPVVKNVNYEPIETRPGYPGYNPVAVHRSRNSFSLPASRSQGYNGGSISSGGGSYSDAIGTYNNYSNSKGGVSSASPVSSSSSSVGKSVSGGRSSSSGATSTSSN